MPTLLPMVPAAVIQVQQEVQSEPAHPATVGEPNAPSTAQQTASWALLAFGVAILIWVLLRLQWRRQRRSPDESPVAQMRETIQDRQAEGERAAQVAEIVRDLAARLETRAARLEALLDQADERIEHLEARLAASTTARQLPGADHAPAPNGTHPPAPTNGEADGWQDPDAEPAGRPSDPSPADPLHQDVYELADNGHSPLDIARRLEQQVGTIELILALRR